MSPKRLTDDRRADAPTEERRPARRSDGADGDRPTRYHASACSRVRHALRSTWCVRVAS